MMADFEDWSPAPRLSTVDRLLVGVSSILSLYGFVASLATAAHMVTGAISVIVSAAS